MQYDVIYTNHIQSFKEMVNDKLKQGWKLAGGICVTYCPISDNVMDHIRYSQAIFKEQQLP